MKSSPSKRWMFLLIIILSGLMGTLFWHLSRLQATAATSMIIVLLTALNGLLLLTLLFVIARSLIELYTQRKNKTKGIRIRTKLVLAVLPLSLIPAGMMYFFSTQVLSRTLQKLSIDANIATVIEEAYDLNKDYAQRLAEHLQPAASMLATTLRDGETIATQNLLEQFALVGVEQYESGNFREAVFSNDLDPEKERRFVRTRRWESQPNHELFDDGFLIWRLPYQSDEDQLVLLVSMDTPFSERWAFLKDSYRYLNHAKRKRDKVSDTFRNTLLIITFAVAFGGIWMGRLFSKSLMRSLNILIKGTDEVAQGQFDNPISLQTGDELEDLGQSFNAMMAQLKANRGELQARALDLEEANSRLKEQARYTETLISQVSAGILSCFQDGRVRTCNPAARQLLMVEPNHLNDLADHPSFEAMERLWSKYHRYGCQPLTQQMEWRMADKDHHVAVTLTPIQYQEGISGTIIVLEDLTNLFNAQKLAAWGEVARRVAHEIKNPLTPIQLSIQRIYRQAKKGGTNLERVIDSSYETITSEIRLLESLVSEFSHFAKLPLPEKTDFDLAALVKNSLESYREVCIPVPLQFESNVETCPVHGDPSQIRQVLSNLIRNARTATEGNAPIIISLHLTEGLIHLEIADSGSGITDEDKTKVFMPYFSKAPKGTGLGLAIVQRIITDHGWKISVRDNQPKGTIFAVLIPTDGIEEADI